jgi:hypothetical protein
MRRCQIAGLPVVGEDDPLPPTGRFVILVAAKAEETKRIKRQVDRIDPEGVDVVSLLDVGTFFWESEEILNNSFNTVKQCLAPGGKFVWKMMNGDLVRSLPQVQETRDGASKIQYGEFTLDYAIKNGTLDKEVFVYIPEGITSEGQDDGRQREWLTSVDEMYGLFPKVEYEYMSRTIDTEETFLPENSKKLSALFEHGVLKKKEPAGKAEPKRTRPAQDKETVTVQRGMPTKRGAARGAMRGQILGRSSVQDKVLGRTTTPKPKIQTKKTEESFVLDLSEI